MSVESDEFVVAFIIAGALDDGHGTIEDEMLAAVAVVDALKEAGFDIVRRRSE